jgi:hypothetical protein
MSSRWLHLQPRDLDDVFGRYIFHVAMPTKLRIIRAIELPESMVPGTCSHTDVQQKTQQLRLFSN